MTKEINNEPINTPLKLDDLVGPLPVPLTNDYLFRALLQKNNNTLKGLISSLLHLPIEHISSVSITNPIILGKTIQSKDFILDIRVLLNNHSIINLEMQVINEHNWADRSLSYLCRSFNHLNSGEDYTFVKPVTQISFLDFSLFPKYPEFYATYQFLNIKNHTVYSDKLSLSVVDLTHIELATEEDHLYQIDHWATLFKAKTWEEIHMLAPRNEYIQDASDTLYKLSSVEAIRMHCIDLDDLHRRQRTQEIYWQSIQEKYDSIKDILANKNKIISEKDNAISEMDKTISEKDKAISDMEAEIARLKSLLSDKQN